MSPEEQHEYAATLILQHARAVEFISVLDMAEEHLDGADEISEEDAVAVHDLIAKAEVTVTWPDSSTTWGSDE